MIFRISVETAKRVPLVRFENLGFPGGLPHEHALTSYLCPISTPSPRAPPISHRTSEWPYENALRYSVEWMVSRGSNGSWGDMCIQNRTEQLLGVDNGTELSRISSSGRWSIVEGRTTNQDPAECAPVRADSDRWVRRKIHTRYIQGYSDVRPHSNN